MLVNGTIGSALVSSSGTGSVYLLGVNTSVVVHLSGVSSVYLRNANRESASSHLKMLPLAVQGRLHLGIVPDIMALDKMHSSCADTA